MRPRPVKLNFKPKARHLRDWAHDQAEMSRGFFGPQTPLFVIAKAVERDPYLASAVRRSLAREFRHHVKFTDEIPRTWRCVALSVAAEASRCSRCGEAAKRLHTRFEYVDHGRVVPSPELHATPAVCPACGHLEEPQGADLREASAA